MEVLKPSLHRVEFNSVFETDYKILGGKPLGEGAFGTVYKCLRKKDGDKIVAVKLVEIKPNQSERAKKEAKLLENLHHENILEIISSWTEQPTREYKYPFRCVLKELTVDVFFIETEFCDLKSLDFWFAVPVPLKDQDAKLLLYQITRGIEYLHLLEKPIVHRDLKPDNILLRSNKHLNTVVAKIGDFGISREIRTTMTNDIGTFPYSGPEMKEEKYSHKVDIYALGVIFCEMLILGECPGQSDLRIRDDAIADSKFNGTRQFIISQSCEKYLSNKIEERRLIEDMVKMPGKDRPDATQIIKKIIGWCPKVDKQTIPIPDIENCVIENANEFRLYGRDTSYETFTTIPATKQVEFLTKFYLDYVSVNASHLISCLEKCVNLNTIEMKIINDSDELFPQIALPNLSRFMYRQLNGPEHIYPYLTEERVNSLLFFERIEQLWENQMTVKIIITTFTLVDIHHEDSQCTISLSAAAGTKQLYDNLKHFVNVTSIYFVDHWGNSDFQLDLEKLPGEASLETLAVDLPYWSHVVNQGLPKFQQLKELYLSAFSQLASAAGIDHRRLVVFRMLPPTIRVLSLSDCMVALKSAEKIDFDSLSFANCTFVEDFPLEKMEHTRFLVKQLYFFIEEMYHKTKNIYEPSWDLLEFLLSDDKCEKAYFGTFDWNAESPQKEELAIDLKDMGVPGNSQRFLLEFNDGWKGKMVEIHEHQKILNESRYRKRFMMPEKDEFQKTEDFGIKSSSYGVSWIPLFETYKNITPCFVQDGSTSNEDYVPCKRLEGTRELKRINLKRVEILDASTFHINLKGCKQLVSLSMENVKMKQIFLRSVELPALKEFFLILDEHGMRNADIIHFFDKERIEGALFFNKKSFKDLWSNKINTLIGVNNQRILEFNHEKGVIWLQFCKYASEIISESGILEDTAEEIKSLIIFNCSGLSENQTIPSSNLTYLNLTLVDMDITAIFESTAYPCLQSFFFEPRDRTVELDLCKIPSSVKKVGLTGVTVDISGEYKTCNFLTLKECILTNNFVTLFPTLLNVRKFGLIGVRMFVKHWRILEPLLFGNICETIFFKHFRWDVIAVRKKSVFSLLKSLELTGNEDKFELNRNVSNDGWSLNKNSEEIGKLVPGLTGIDILQRTM